MAVQRFLRSICRWLTRHRRAGSCRTRRDAGKGRGRSFDQFTERARKVMQLAQEEAQCLHHDFIGTEHLLLGLVREGEGIGAGVLESLGLSLQEVRRNFPLSFKPGGQLILTQCTVLLRDALAPAKDHDPQQQVGPVAAALPTAAGSSPVRPGR